MLGVSTGVDRKRKVYASSQLTVEMGTGPRVVPWSWGTSAFREAFWGIPCCAEGWHAKNDLSERAGTHVEWQRNPTFAFIGGGLYLAAALRDIATAPSADGTWFLLVGGLKRNMLRQGRYLRWVISTHCSLLYARRDECE